MIKTLIIAQAIALTMVFIPPPAVYCAQPSANSHYMLSKFERLSARPILGPRQGHFDQAGAFNPTATRLDNGKVVLLYRAQDNKGVSRVGYAESTDGVHFNIAEQAVLSPSSHEDRDGIEDPRLTRAPGDKQKWLLTATAYNKTDQTAQLVSYESADLKSWTRRSTIVPCGQGKWNTHWTKSGALVTNDDGVPLKIDGKFWMFYMGDAKSGHDQMGIVSSKDGLNWSDATENPVLPHRPGMFDSKVVEPGPHTIVTKEGLLLLYNGADDLLTYRTGWALFDKKDPTKLLARADKPLFEPEESWEKKNASKSVYQAPNVVFVEGIVKDSADTYKVYYGCADSYAGVARTKLEYRP